MGKRYCKKHEEYLGLNNSFRHRIKMTIKVKIIRAEYDKDIEDVEDEINKFFKFNDGITKDHLVRIEVIDYRGVIIIWDDMEIEEK